MATHDDSAAIHARPGLSLNSEGLRAAMECTWEAEALCSAALGLVGGKEMSKIEDGSDFVLRALILRLQGLNGALMAVLNEDTTVHAINQLLFDGTKLH